MLTREEIGIAEWRFYESKRRYAEAQASERESGEFLQLPGWCISGFREDD